MSEDEKKIIKYIIWKPEKLDHCGWHQHAYVEFTKPIGGPSVTVALGQQVRKKGSKGGFSAKNKDRKGNKAQAIGYVVSDEWCRKCHTGDCNGAKWLFEEPHNLPAWVPEEHEECRKEVHKKIVDLDIPAWHIAHVKHVKYKCELKGTCGEVQSFGTPAIEGSGGKRDGSGSGKISAEILDAIKGGMSFAQVNEQHHAWCSGHNGWVKDMIALHSVRVTPAKFTLAAMCQALRQHPIEWAHPHWEHSVVVVGNAGIGKTEWALAHFERPLLVNDIDKLKGFDPERFDGIVFDDMGFEHWPVQCQIHITDWTQPRDIRCRFFNGTIPAKTRKIFCCNWERFPFTRDDAVMDRLCVIETDKTLESMRKKPPVRRAWTETVALALVDTTEPEPKKPRKEPVEAPVSLELEDDCLFTGPSPHSWVGEGIFTERNPKK